MTEKMVDCWACDGQGFHPCDCQRCRTPEGEAWGTMGHGDEECEICRGEGELPEGVERVGDWWSA